MDRRTFLAGTGAVLLAGPRAAEAQQPAKVPRIGWLLTGFTRQPLPIGGCVPVGGQETVCDEVEL